MVAKRLGDTTDDGALLLGGPGYVPPVTFGGLGGRRRIVNPYTRQVFILGAAEPSFLSDYSDYVAGGIGGDGGDSGSGDSSGDGDSGGGGPAGDGGDY
jgi:hypothetical protein